LRQHDRDQAGKREPLQHFWALLSNDGRSAEERSAAAIG
jgi:hypothetical protein